MFSKVKKNENERKRTNLPFVRSGTVRSASPVRPGSISKKKRRTLITFPKVKKQKPNKRREKERAYLFVRSGTVRSASSVRLSSIPKKKRKRTLITLLRSKNK